MRDILPNVVVDYLGDRFKAGVSDAEAQFDNAVGDEDSLTGALGQAISRLPTHTFLDGDDIYQVNIGWKKLRGRGLNAPEKLYGPDGLFQIAVVNAEGHVIRMKALPFQAKTRWRGTSKSVAKQCSDIETSLGGGILIDYNEHGYEACSTKSAAAVGGNRNAVKKKGQLHSLGQVLGEDFLACRIGRLGLIYDPESERFYGPGSDDVPQLLQPANTITTLVRKASR